MRTVCPQYRCPAASRKTACRSVCRSSVRPGEKNPSSASLTRSNRQPTGGHDARHCDSLDWPERHSRMSNNLVDSSEARCSSRPGVSATKEAPPEGSRSLRSCLLTDILEFRARGVVIQAGKGLVRQRNAALGRVLPGYVVTWRSRRSPRPSARTSRRATDCFGSCPSPILDRRRLAGSPPETLPFSCPFGAPRCGKRQQRAAQSETGKSSDSRCDAARSGSVQHTAAKGG